MLLPMTTGHGAIWNLSTSAQLNKLKGMCAVTSLNGCMLFSDEGKVNGYVAYLLAILALQHN